jgi:primosomal protein N' (replication factor Y)
MLTLVGVVDADLGLAGGDLRAAERTYQLLHQVAGRAGRAERPGQVLLQTYDPDHPVIRAMISDDRDGLIAHELAERRAHGMPPFGRLAALILSSHDQEKLDQTARSLARLAPSGPGISVLGPAPAPMALLRGRHRRRFLLKCRRDISPQALIREWLGKVKLPGTVRLQIDIDPYSFL